MIARKGLLCLVFSLAWPAVAAAQGWRDKVDMGGDLRFRIESDWDARRPDGSTADPRTRFRLRGRLGVRYSLSPSAQLGVRFRTGTFDSQQSANTTLWDFSSDSAGDQRILPDQYFLGLKGEHFSLWMGRNQLPFWKTSEALWDDDVTPAGVGGTYAVPLARGNLDLNGGLMATPDGGLGFHSAMLSGQAVYGRSLGEFTLKASAGWILLQGKPGATYLRNQNGQRDYSLLVNGFELAWRHGGAPVILSGSHYRNLESYDSGRLDEYTLSHRDQRTGFDVGLSWGELKRRGDLTANYTFARVEALAVNASYAHDDWFRWGGAGQSDASDYQGHEVRLGYAVSENLNIVPRLYLTRSLSEARRAKRFRLDFNFRF